MSAGIYIDEFFAKLYSTEITDELHNVKPYIEGFDDLTELFKNQKCGADGTVYFMGNGGSAAIAIHMTADYMKNGRMRTSSLYDPAILTCLGNDYGYEHVFAKQLENHVGNNDLIVAISSSGESVNIIEAIETVHHKGAKVLSLTGFGPGNTVRRLSDVSVYVPDNRYGIVESIHNMILQQVVDSIVSECDE